MMLLISYGGGLVDQFQFIVEISVFAALIPFLFTAAAYILVIIEKKMHANSWVKTFVLGSLGFAYSLWTIWGSGRDTTFYGFMILLSGIPFYLLMKWQKRDK
jgi:APA family basic amino acid/polyamine antiporter